MILSDKSAEQFANEEYIDGSSEGDKLSDVLFVRVLYSRDFWSRDDRVCVYIYIYLDAFSATLETLKVKRPMRLTIYYFIIGS